MADYDVGVIQLTVPAATAPLARCRPVVSIRNNGIHDAIASGYLRIYSAGLLVFETECYSDTIGPGKTRPASAIDYWTPEHEGPYMVQGYFSTPLDQVQPNNNLWPTAVIISGVVPPPPTPVPLHASQHEEGGSDELSIEGLPGRAADQQRAINHASNHELGGIDPINVEGMPGVLMERQNPKLHAATHKVAGNDPLDVLALPNVTQLELVARKGKANGYASLDTNAAVPIVQLILGSIVPEPDEDPETRGLRQDRFLGPVNPVHHAARHEPGGLDPVHIPAEILNSTGASVTVDAASGETTIATITVPAEWMNATLGLVLNAAGRLTSVVSPGELLRLKLKKSTVQGSVTLLTLDIDVSMIYEGSISLRTLVAATDYLHVKTYMEFLANEDALKSIGPHVVSSGNAFAISAVETVFSLTAEFPGAGISHRIYIDISHSWNTGKTSAVTGDTGGGDAG